MHASRTSPANNKELRVAPCLGRCTNFTFDIETSRKSIRGPPQTVYRHYSRNNAYPSPLELASIKAELKEATSTLSDITNIVTRLKAETDALEAEKSRVNQVMLDYRSILRPIHRLPPELLERIFSFSVDIPELYDSSGYREYPQSSLDPRKSPWTLAQVCQSFRKLALATPSLWSFISFGFLGLACTANPESLAYLHAHNHRLRLQLQRSSDYPLTVMTHTPGGMTPIDRSLFQLCSHTNRWRSLRIELHSSLTEELSQIRGSLPNLESLDIHCLGSGIKRVDCFEFAPRLKKLVLSGNHEFHVDLIGLSLPLLQITDYTYYDGSNVEDFIAWALVCHHFVYIRYKVEKLRLFLHSWSVKMFHTMRVQRPDSAKFRTFHCLTELELHSAESDGPTGTSIDELLYWIEAPLLTKLTVTTSGRDRTALLRSLSRPETLISLTIHRVNMSSKEFSAILARLWSLRDLRFGVEGGLGNAHLSTLLPPSPTHNFSIVPKLQNLALLPVQGSESSYSDHKLLNMLEARRKALESGSSLQSIRLDRRLRSELAKPRLDRLREEGLQILEM